MSDKDSTEGLEKWAFIPVYMIVFLCSCILLPLYLLCETLHGLILLVLSQTLPCHVATLMRPMDRFFINNSKSSTTILALKIKGTANVEKVKKTFNEKVLDFSTNLATDGKTVKETYYPYNAFRWMVAQTIFFSYWKRDNFFDIERHIQVQNLTDIKDNIKDKMEGTNEGKSMLDQELERVAESYWQRDSWPKKKPQWEITLLVPNYMDKDEQEYYFILALHPSYGDGTSLIQLLRHALADPEGSSTSPSPFEVFVQDPSLTPQSQKSNLAPWLGMVMYVVRLVGLVLCLPHRMAVMFCRNFPYAGQNEKFLIKVNDCSPSTFEHCRFVNVELNKVKLLQKKYALEGGREPLKFSTVILSCISNVLAKINEKTCPSNLLWATAHANDPYPTLDLMNNYTMSTIAVPTNTKATTTKDRADGFAAVQSVVKQGSTTTLLKTLELNSIADSNLIRQFSGFFTRLQTASLTLNNVPGPRNTIKIFRGQPVLDIILFPPQHPNSATTFLTISYASNIKICMTASYNTTFFHRNFANTVLPKVKEEIQRLS